MAIANLDIQVIVMLASGGEEERYKVVDKVIEHIKESGLKYEVGALGTTVEGEFKELLKIVEVAQEICFKEGAGRVCTIAKFDHKKEGVTIAEKVAKHRSKKS